MDEKEYILAGITGFVVGDALGVPVEFKKRKELKEIPVTDMEEFGTYNQPAGTWSDDSSMTLCTLDSLCNGLDYEDIMDKFSEWLLYGDYTPYKEVFDVGTSTSRAIMNYGRKLSPIQCGGKTEYDNGNGSLMRMLPIAFYTWELYHCSPYNQQRKQKTKQEQVEIKNREIKTEEMKAEEMKAEEIRIEEINTQKIDVKETNTEQEEIQIIHNSSRMTHAHVRSLIACGIYVKVVHEVISKLYCQEKKVKDELNIAIEIGIKKAKAFYQQDLEYKKELEFYRRVDTSILKNLEEEDIKSSGYVVDTLEAVLWCLLTTKSFEQCVLKAVNLGEDTDTITAIAGGIAGIYYGYESIPKKWIEKIAAYDKIKEICSRFCNRVK